MFRCVNPVLLDHIYLFDLILCVILFIQFCYFNDCWNNFCRFFNCITSLMGCKNPAEEKEPYKRLETMKKSLKNLENNMEELIEKKI